MAVQVNISSQQRLSLFHWHGSTKVATAVGGRRVCGYAVHICDSTEQHSLCHSSSSSATDENKIHTLHFKHVPPHRVIIAAVADSVLGCIKEGRKEGREATVPIIIIFQ